MKTGIQLIAQERAEQIEKHGYTLGKDEVQNQAKELSFVAAILLQSEFEEGIDPHSYPEDWDKEILDYMLSKSYRDRLIIAGALIAAEIDRIL